MHLLAKAFGRPRAPVSARPEDESSANMPRALALILGVPQEEIPPSETPSSAGTLFTYGFDAGLRPTSFVVSICVHSVVIAIIWFAFAYRPITTVNTARYTARLLDLQMPDPPKQVSKWGATYPGSHDTASKPAHGGKPSPAPQPVLPQMPQIKPGPQTLIQPDIPNQVMLNEEIPLPKIVIWTPSNTPVKSIVPPMPQKPTAADVKPTIDVPTQEVNLADVNIAPSDHPSPRNMVLASTTSPVAIHDPQPVQSPPVSATQKAAQPTPATVLSLSDLRMKDGTTMLPPANEAKASKEQGELTPGQLQDSSPQGSGNARAISGQTGAGPASANVNGSGTASADLNGPGSATASIKSNAAGPGSGVGPGAGPAAGSAGTGSKPETSAPAPAADLPSELSGQMTVLRIALPKDGRFSAVVVGNSLDERYPEVADVWKGRIVYTAYLHVGLAKSWILQFSLPRDADASAAGAVARLDAPWPYDIVRPNLDPGSIGADALMVHGFIDLSGRFQGLGVKFPPAFPQAQFVLDALQKWQFRPAMQNGQPLRVEMLLIVPDIED